jgi:hypothetical protein
MVWDWPDAEIIGTLDELAKKCEYVPVQRDWFETRNELRVRLGSLTGDPLHHAGGGSSDPDVPLNQVDSESEVGMRETERKHPGWYRTSTLMMLSRCKSGMPFWRSVSETLVQARALGLPAWELRRLSTLVKQSKLRRIENDMREADRKSGTA